jgi:epoxyqueuosine reductase
LTKADLTAQERKNLIFGEARRLGFSFMGVSTATFLEEEAPRLEAWLKAGMHGKMAYMEGHFDKRLDPRLLVPGARSVVSLLLNYFPEAKQPSCDARISMYAYGEDYHHVIKEKLFALVNFIRQNIGEVDGRAFVDSAPVMDKAWATRSGIGWMGKHTNLINKGHGSYFFIAELIIDLELPPDGPASDHCGTCTACIDACPTDAIVQPYVVDGSKCISYFTIELKEALPEDYANQLGEWIFGCDICQEVCPWNRFSRPHSEPRFSANEALLGLNRKDWLDISEEVFKELTRRSPISRPGWEGMQRNARAGK